MTNLLRVSKHNNATNWVYRRYRALTRTDLHGEKALLPGQDARVADPHVDDQNPNFEKNGPRETGYGNFLINFIFIPSKHNFFVT